MYVDFHFVKGAGQNRNDDKVGTGQSLLQGVGSLILPLGQGTLCAVELASDDHVVLGCFPVNVVERYLAADVRGRSQVAHQTPGPAAGATADVGDFQIFYFIVFIIHNGHPPAIFF